MASLRTKWMSAAQAAVPAGTEFASRLQMPEAGLVVWAVGMIKIPGTTIGWTSDFVRVRLNINSQEALMSGETPIPGSLLYDDDGARYLDEPIPLRQEQHLLVGVTNDGSNPYDVMAVVQYVPMSPNDLVRYCEDGEFRAVVKAQLALSRTR